MIVPHAEIERQVQQALQEDVGTGDITASLLPNQQLATAGVIAREPGILCGSAWFEEVFRQLNPNITIEWNCHDGDPIESGQQLCSLVGPGRDLLTGERTALNFLQTLSGTATQTHKYVTAISGTKTRILDTRKTVPGLRLAQKYAVHCGGGQNHRMGLYDMILIKENHITSKGSITTVINEAKQHGNVEFEVEVEDLDQLQEAIDAGAKRILLDNFNLDSLRLAVEQAQGRASLEASGNITLDNIRKIAETGVDYISTGAITKNIQALDLSMRVTSVKV